MLLLTGRRHPTPWAFVYSSRTRSHRERGGYALTAAIASVSGQRRGGIPILVCKRFAGLDREQPHGPPWCYISPHPIINAHFHFHFPCLLASSSGVVGAMHFGSALKHEEYLAAKKIVGDKRASPRKVADASAVVARLDQEKAENMAANGTTIFPVNSR